MKVGPKISPEEKAAAKKAEAEAKEAAKKADAARILEGVDLSAMNPGQLKTFTTRYVLAIKNLEAALTSEGLGAGQSSRSSEQFSGAMSTLKKQIGMPQDKANEAFHVLYNRYADLKDKHSENYKKRLQTPQSAVTPESADAPKSKLK